MKRCLECEFRFVGNKFRCPSCGFEPQEKHGVIQFAPKLNDTAEGFDPEAFERLYISEESNFWFQSRNKLILWSIEEYFPGARKFLEIGCGTGFVLSAVTSRFQAMECAGSELHSAGLNFAKMRLPQCPMWQMDARQIPYFEEFDLLGAFDVIEHIKEDEIVLEQMYKAVRPGGGILLTVPQHPWLWSEADELACHQRRYQKSELVGKVQKAGFRVIGVSSFVTLLLPMMIASRLSRRFSSEQAESELVLPEYLNAIFLRVMKFELALIRAGLRLPLGGSLILTAKKS